VSKPKPPRTLDQATAILAHYAEVHAQLAEVEAGRTADLGRVNAAADAVAAPLVAELEQLQARLQPWWETAGQALAPKGRKSMQLGGCMIGSRTSRPKLAHGFADDDKAVEALQGTRYGKQTTRVRYSLDRGATLKLIQIKGRPAEKLAELGFRVEQSEQFFIEPVEQGGTIADA
jgi:phage host-nuclease inhibitor protein Gam